ncbi:CAAX protease self-immunity [Cryobacterium luteum]|nr:CAAX protease self-immunity [Cryobacterium luteum]
MIVTALIAGRVRILDLLRRMVAVRGRLRWRALAALGPLVLFAIAVFVARLVDGVWPDTSRFGASVEYAFLPVLVFWTANLIFYGFGEEIGWRGFAQPTLQFRHSTLRAAVLVAAARAAWHPPLFGITPTYRTMPAAGFIVVAVFHAVFDIATTTPATTTLIPTLMGAGITIVGLLVIPSLLKSRA